MALVAVTLWEAGDPPLSTTLTACLDDSLLSLCRTWGDERHLDPGRICLRTGAGAFHLDKETTLRSLLPSKEDAAVMELFMEPLSPVTVAVQGFPDLVLPCLQAPLAASPAALTAEVCRQLQLPHRNLRWSCAERRLNLDAPLQDQGVRPDDRLTVDLQFHVFVEHIGGKTGDPALQPKEVYCFGSDSPSLLLLDPDLPTPHQRLLVHSEPFPVDGTVAEMLAPHGGLRRWHWVVQLEHKMTLQVQYPAPRGWTRCHVWPTDAAHQLLEGDDEALLWDDQKLDSSSSFLELGIYANVRLWVARTMQLRVENSRGVIRELRIADSATVVQLRRLVAAMEPTRRFQLQFDGACLEPENRLLHRCGVTDGAFVKLVRRQLAVILAYHGRHFSLGYLDEDLSYSELVDMASRVLGTSLDHDTVFECATCRRTVSMETKAQCRLPAACCEVKPRLLRVHRPAEVQLMIHTQADNNSDVSHVLTRPTSTSLHELMAFVTDQLQRERDLAEDEGEYGVPLSEVAALGDMVRLQVRAEVMEEFEFGARHQHGKRSEAGEMGELSGTTWWWWNILSWFRSRDHCEARQPDMSDTHLMPDGAHLAPRASSRASDHHEAPADDAFTADPATPSTSAVAHRSLHARRRRMASYDTLESDAGSVDWDADLSSASELRGRSGDGPLLDVTLSRDTTFVARFIESGGNVNALLSDGTTLLAVAAANGNEETLRMLLNGGAAVDGTCRNGVSALHIAADAGSDCLVERLLEGGATVNVPLKNGFTPLLLAARHGHVAVVRHLLDYGADPNCTLGNGVTGLYMAAEHGVIALARVFLERGADINKERRTGATPLFIAAQSGQTEMVRFLIRNDAHIDKAMKNGATPLYIGCQNGHWNTVRVLVESGANVNYTMVNGATPVFCSAQNGQIEVLTFLLRNGAQVNMACNDGTTPLFVGAQNGHLEVVRRLIACGSDVNSVCDNGASSLFIAAQNGHVDVLRHLLENGAQVDSSCKDGTTPIYIAAQNGHSDIINVLMDFGGNVHKARNDQMTPMRIARLQGHNEVVDVLKSQGSQLTGCLLQ